MTTLEQYPGTIENYLLIKEQIKNATGGIYHVAPKPVKLQSSDFDFLIKSLTSKKGA